MAIPGRYLVMARSVNVKVERKDNENIERLIRRFVKKVKKEGILEEYREKMYYEKPSDKKRRVKSAQKRAAQRKREEQQKMNLERKN